MPIVLVFARQPIPGRVKTRLAATIGDQAACRLYTAFLMDLCTHLAKSGKWQVAWWVEGDPGALRAELGPLWVDGWDCRRQPAGNLGQRLRVAFDDAFDGSGGPVAVLGSDCPEMGRDHLAGMFSALEDGFDAVLLPADDGGYAALALAANVPDLFRGIPWSTPEVAEVTLARLAGAKRRVSVLPPLADVDTAADLTRLERRLRGCPERAPHTTSVLAALRAGEDP